jgi:hypothetical protein
MRMTVGELRALIRRLDERSPEFTRADVADNIQYDVEEQQFKDRYGNPLPIRGPSSMDPRDVDEWLGSNRVQSIDVRGRRLSPKNFIKFLNYMRTGNKPGADSVAEPMRQAKTFAVPIVKGTPVAPGDGLGKTQLSKTMITPRRRQ